MSENDLDRMLQTSGVNIPTREEIPLPMSVEKCEAAISRRVPLDADGKISDPKSLFFGMTPAQVMADREAYRRACGE